MQCFFGRVICRGLKVYSLIPFPDGSWIHWNHEYIPQWDKNDKKVYPSGKHNPDLNDVGANFFPQLGAYRYKLKHPKIITKLYILLMN